MRPRPLVAGAAAVLLAVAAWVALRPGSPSTPDPAPPRASGGPTPTTAIIPATGAPRTPTGPPVTLPGPVGTDSSPAVSELASPSTTPNATNLPNSPEAATASSGNPATTGDGSIPSMSIRLDKIRLMFRDYRTLMGENPVGTNAEIMKSVMGGNPRGATLGPPEGQDLNSKGELIDAWGTPYFFHQLSREHMEIISAGPDRVFGTADDVKQN